MRKYAGIFGVCLMVICIGFGIYLPRIVFSKTQDKSSKQIEKYEIEPVEIGYLNTVINAMRSCGDGEYTFDYQEEMANLSRQQLIETCNSFLAELKLSEWGYHDIIVNNSNMKANCYLVVLNYDEQYRFKIREAQSFPENMDDTEYQFSTGDNEKIITISTVIWRIEVTCSSDCTIVFAVDDKNQKVIQMYSNQYYAKSSEYVDMSSDYNDMSSDYTYQDLYDMDDYVSEVIIPFFKNYYDVNVEIVESGNQNCILRMTDKNDDVILISLFDYGGQIDLTLFL